MTEVATSNVSDFVISWSELVSGQASDLWTAGIGFLVAQTLVICALISSGKGLAARVTVSVSWIATLASLACGYFVKGAVIVGMEEMVKTAVPAIRPEDVSGYALYQFAFLVAGMLIFLVTFALDRKLISSALLGR